MADEASVTVEPWEQLKALMDAGDAAPLTQLVQALPPGDLARALARLEEEDRSRLLTLLPPQHAAEVVDELSHTQAADIIEDLRADQAARIIDELDSDEQADILGELNDEDAEAIIAQLDPEEREDVRLLTTYGPDTAGGIMITEFLSYPAHMRVDQVISDIRANAEEFASFDVQYVYVIERESGKLLGVVRLRDLLMSPGHIAITDVMIATPYKVHVGSDLDALEEFFDRHSFYAAPVVDDAGKMLGVVRRAHLEEALGERSDKAMMRLGGIIGGEELRTMATGTRALQRLTFLGPSVALNLVAASIIAINEEVIARVTALAIFLPILSAMAGNSGYQAVAVSMRELSLGLARPDDFWIILRKELSVGVINGVILGVALGLIATAMRGREWALIGVVVGVAMILNNILATILGGTIPLLLKRLRFDPALASGPILTTTTDLCTFFLTIVLAIQILL